MIVRTRLIVAILSVSAGLAAQRSAALRPDDFKIEIQLDRLPAISQGRTGTCWSFATTSFFESEVKRLRGDTVDLSEMFGVYQAWLAKSDTFVKLQGKAQLSQGGLSHDLVAMARRHGLVPQSVYTGLREGQGDYDHDELEKVLAALLPIYAKADRPSDAWRDAVRGVVDAYLGAPPATFEVDGQKVTPQQYARETLGLPLDHYVELMSLESEGFGARAELMVPDNWMRDSNYWNVPIAELMENIDHALRAGMTLAIDCDVSEPTNDRGRALMRLSPQNEKREITDDFRQKLFDSRETTDDHLMHIVGRATDPDDGVWYLIKNSWGDGGPFDGHLMMSRNYLALKTLAVMVHVDGVTEATRKRFQR